MPSNSWLNGWLTGDVWSASEFSKSMGSFYDSTLGGLSATFDITSVPAWGAHLLLIVAAKGSTAALTSKLQIRFNNDSTAVYWSQDLSGSAGTPAAAEVAGATRADVAVIPAASDVSADAGISQIWVPFFRGTTWRKTFNSTSWMLCGGGSGQMQTRTSGGFWGNTAAITRITLLLDAGSFSAGSRCTGYILGP